MQSRLAIEKKTTLSNRLMDSKKDSKRSSAPLAMFCSMSSNGAVINTGLDVT